MNANMIDKPGRLARLLYWLTRNRPMRVIQIGGEDYLERYFLFAILGRQVWLHRFLRNDSERHVHDHPFAALSVVLTGGYTEEIATPFADDFHLCDFVDRRAPALNWIGARKRHRIVSVAPNTWTLMLVGRRHGRGWWFYDDGPDGIVRTQPFASTPDDWYRRAKSRAHVYSGRPSNWGAGA